ncbi:Endo-1,4-beta-xylanase A [bioreactor metagenome]|uniref:Endo-1,4-beta-xylanase A n=1 Tax=bioreactor metagenome TaxID=1076179 RepID=A0A645D1F0_9ZZZZ
MVVEANGTERHVPTEVYSKGGKWYAKINSMTNSTYALIQNNVSFTDTTGKWYAAVATEMASRKVISGIGEKMFAGDRSITRAEFAAILIRALGLPADGTSIFSDISASAWYSGSVATATQYGLVTGKGDNRFAPDDYITRQEAMTMLQRAAKLTGYMGTVGSLENFTDTGSVGTWAQGAAKWNVGSGLIVGSGELLRPNDNISRAESATVILRLLQRTGLVDVRTEA